MQASDVLLNIHLVHGNAVHPSDTSAQSYGSI